VAGSRRTTGPAPGRTGRGAARPPARPWPAAPTIIGPANWVEERGDRAAALVDRRHPISYHDAS
jgi:hypothetical protein